MSVMIQRFNSVLLHDSFVIKYQSTVKANSQSLFFNIYCLTFGVFNSLLPSIIKNNHHHHHNHNNNNNTQSKARYTLPVRTGRSNGYIGLNFAT